MLVSKLAESEDLEKKCAVSIKSKMLSEYDSKLTTGQEEDFANLWPPLLTYGLHCVYGLYSVAAFGFQKTGSFSQPTLLIKFQTLP